MVILPHPTPRASDRTSTRHQVCLQIYAAPGRHALGLLISARRTGAVGWWAGARAYLRWPET
eukprot:968567-Prymnesium_polylepis.1